MTCMPPLMCSAADIEAKKVPSISATLQQLKEMTNMALNGLRYTHSRGKDDRAAVAPQKRKAHDEDECTQPSQYSEAMSGSAQPTGHRRR